MANLHCECQELKPKVETNSSFLVFHLSSGVDTVNTVGSHLDPRTNKVGKLGYMPRPSKVLLKVDLLSYAETFSSCLFSTCGEAVNTTENSM